MPAHQALVTPYLGVAQASSPSAQVKAAAAHTYTNAETIQEKEKKKKIALIMKVLHLGQISCTQFSIILLEDDMVCI